MKFNHTIPTDGSGYWSSTVKNVPVTSLSVSYDEDEDWGELCVTFDTDVWDIGKDGLIYTDDKFEEVLKHLLTMQGLDGSDVEYSEQGMQGDYYVSFDITEDFIKSWKKINKKG